MDAWRTALTAYIREQALPVEKYGHQPRLYALCQLVGHGLAWDDDAVFAAAWLHDLGVFTGHRPEDPGTLAHWDHTAYAIDKTPALLTRLGFPTARIPVVLDCIRHHQPSGEPTTTEATILRDADILEQLGAVAILRTVCKVGRDTRFQTFTDAVRALTRALETLPAQLRLPAAKHLAEERISAHRAFLEAIAREAGSDLF
jgi:uncharacterized protein